MRIKTEPTKRYLKSIFAYKDGMLFWKKIKPPHGIAKVGDRAGSQHIKGYRTICLEKKSYYEHRIIWTLLNGRIPKGMQIDHRDQIRNNNNIDNLRLGSHGQNQQNSGVYKNSKSGYRGVCISNRGRIVAYINVNKNRIFLGDFKTIESAAEAYKEASIKYHKQFSKMQQAV